LPASEKPLSHIHLGGSGDEGGIMRGAGRRFTTNDALGSVWRSG